MIVQQGGILDMVTGRAEIRINPQTGREIKRFWTGYDKKYYLDVDLATGVMLEKKERIGNKDVIIKQSYTTKQDGSLEVAGAQVEEIYSDMTKCKSEYNKDGKQTKFEVYDASGNLLFRRTPQSNLGYIPYDTNGYPLSCIEEDLVNGITYKIDGGITKLLDVKTVEPMPTPTYVRDTLKTSFDNAVGFMDSQFSYIENMLAEEELLSPNAYSTFFKAVTISQAQYEMRYGNEFDLLTSSLTSSEKELLTNYLGLRSDMIINPWNYAETPTAAEISLFRDLQVPSQGVDFVMAVVHGIGENNANWASHLDGVPIKGQHFKLDAITWNTREDIISNIIGGLPDYIFDASKRTEITRTVKEQIISAWQEAQALGKPFDLASHSLGTVITYEALRELAVESPEIQVRNLYMMGTPLPYFIEKGLASYDPTTYSFSNVRNAVNIYNPVDALNVIRYSGFGAGIAIGNTALMGAIGYNPVSRGLKPYFSNVKDVQLFVPHTAMWKDTRMLEVIQENGQFN